MIMKGCEKVMAYFHSCPKCGANLDPGEKCDCEKERQKFNDIYSKNFKTMPTGQVVLNLGK